MRRLNRESLSPGLALVLNVSSVLAIEGFQILPTTTQGTNLLGVVVVLLTVLGVSLGPWILAIVLSMSKERAIGVRLFSIITVLTLLAVMAWGREVSSEYIGYTVAIQVILAWITLGVCALIKTKPDTNST